jgi:hypothetical protein
MHTVEQYVNGEFLAAARFTDIQDAYEFANNIDGLVIPSGMTDEGAIANRRLDWLEANCGWFCVADER